MSVRSVVMADWYASDRWTHHEKPLAVSCQSAGESFVYGCDSVACLAAGPAACGGLSVPSYCCPRTCTNWMREL